MFNKTTILSIYYYNSRDKSSPITFYYDSPNSAKEYIPTWIHHQHLHKTYESDNYILRNNQVHYFKLYFKVFD